MSDIAIKVENLSKVYYSYNKPRYRLQEMLKPVLGKVHRRFDRQYADEFWALKDVSFEVKKGEAFGIIGRNGAGKSTLLQIIAGTLNPTAGNVSVVGRVNALLELGSGFNPEFTGRENVYLNGAILGFSKEYIDEKFNEIHEFSEIGKYIDQPVKTYSSGMFVRLAFSVQALMDPEILIVDEALSVGDIFFVQKCFRRIDQLIDRGCTLLFVTHDIGLIEKYCRTAILIDRGVVCFSGKPNEVIGKYFALAHQDRHAPAPTDRVAAKSIITRANAVGVSLDRATRLVDDGTVTLHSLVIADSSGQEKSLFTVGENIVVSTLFSSSVDLGVPVSGVTIKNAKSMPLYSKNNLGFDFVTMPEGAEAGSVMRFSQRICLNLAPGKYLISAGFASIENAYYVKRDIIPSAEINEHLWVHLSMEGITEIEIIGHDNGLRVPFNGYVDLPSEMTFEIIEASGK